MEFKNQYAALLNLGIENTNYVLSKLNGDTVRIINDYVDQLYETDRRKVIMKSLAFDCESFVINDIKDYLDTCLLEINDCLNEYNDVVRDFHLVMDYNKNDCIIVYNSNDDFNYETRLWNYYINKVNEFNNYITYYQHIISYHPSLSQYENIEYYDKQDNLNLLYYEKQMENDTIALERNLEQDFIDVSDDILYHFETNSDITIDVSSTRSVLDNHDNDITYMSDLHTEHYDDGYLSQYDRYD